MKKQLITLLVFLLVFAFGVVGWANAQSLTDDPRVITALKMIEVWVDAQLAYEDIPGMSMGVVYNQELIWSRGFGVADVSKKRPAAPSTIYSICSISKLFTSISIMQLWEQGKLRLDDPITKYLPWFNIKDKYPDAPEITIQGILTHSSGLPREADHHYWTGPEYNFPTREQIIDRLSGQEELYPADTFYQYSNLGMALLGEVIAAVSGQAYDVYVNEHILDPLGLNDTTPEIPEDQRGKKLATGYSMKLRDGERREVPFYLVNGIAPAAGFASTVEDLARFASWQFRLLEKGGEEVLAVNTLKKMHRVHWFDPDWRTTRGLGFSVSRQDEKIQVGHGGSCPGYRTQLAIRPKDKIAVIVMTNAQGVSPSAFGREVFDIVAPAILDTIKNPGKAKKHNPDLEKFIGRYDRPLGGETHVFIKDGQLVMMYLPSDNPSDSLTKLKHIEKNIFRRIRNDDELAEAVIFETDPAGNVTRLIRNSQYYIRVGARG
jgi:CubicO group peptidase (beta-lactamase class C family)